MTDSDEGSQEGKSHFVYLIKIEEIGRNKLSL